MLFGLTNVSALFMNLMNRVFHPYVGEFLMVFIVDTRIYSKSKEEHNEYLGMVLRKP